MQNNKRNQVYYVVLNGRKPGIYKNHQQALKQVDGFPYGKMRKVRGLQAAKKLFNEGKASKLDHNIYYVVKNGKNPGIYSDKNKALRQIKGYPNGTMKRIKGYNRAKTYFYDRDRKRKKTIPNIFVDGSYIQHESFAGYGFIAVVDHRVIAKDSGTILDYDIINMHSLGSEMFAYIRAIEWAMANDYNKIRIIYDSKAILQLLEGKDSDLKNSKGKAKLINLYEQYRKHIRIEHFHKNSNKFFREWHKEAHHLSRLTSIMLYNQNDY